MAHVTQKLRDDFQTWAADRVVRGEWTNAEIEGLKALLRVDFTPGHDQLRAGLKVIIDNGIEVSATIDDHADRYRLWANFFANETSARIQSEIDGVPGEAGNHALAKGGER